MKRKDELKQQIELLEGQIEPLQKELTEIYHTEAKETEERVKLCHQLKAKFDQSELIFAAYSRCSCGAGFAYPKEIGIHGSWSCSAILTGIAEKGSKHDGDLPFAFYEIK